MNLSAGISEKTALMWAVADKLTGVYKPHEYGEVILPMIVIRCFDSVPFDAKADVLEKYEPSKRYQGGYIDAGLILKFLPALNAYRREGNAE